MTLRERWNATETKFGTWVKNGIGKVFLACGALGAANDYLRLVPADWIPSWVKTAVVVAGVAGFLSGKLTAKKPEITKPENGKV